MNVLNVKKLKYDGEESNYWRLKAKKALESIKRQSLVTANLILVRLFIVIWQQLETCLLLGESGERKGEKKREKQRNPASPNYSGFLYVFSLTSVSARPDFGAFLQTP